jgi:uncharacterized membrane protein YeaQ/YmgE (transglycosylase-associated protein family)
MDLFVVGGVAGVLGTLAMDSLNLVFARTGILSRIDVGMIGRLAAGWARGRFRYGHPSEVKRVANETPYGYITHYSIGVILADWGGCLWRSDDRSLALLGISVHGAGSVWQAVSRRH